MDWTGLRFSPDGKHLLLSTCGSKHVLLDAFDGKMKRTYTSHANDSGLALDATFSPDANYVLSGSEDGAMHVWETQSGKRAVMWKGGHSGPTARVAWNPTKMLVASACTQLGLWIPAPEASKVLSSVTSVGATASASAPLPTAVPSGAHYGSNSSYPSGSGYGGYPKK